jgi:short-subunit dehydrogenase
MTVTTDEFRAKYGPWALVVGGSEGVGAEFSGKLAALGLDLVIVARKPGPLEEVAALCREAGVEVRTVTADVSDPLTALARVREVTDDVEVGLLVYMAGANTVNGPFTEIDIEKVRQVIAMNVGGQLEFTHHFGELMRVRGRGGIVLIGSNAGNVGTPRISHYGAAKAFSRIFSEAIWYELKPYGVDVLHLLLSFTATPAMARLGYDVSVADDPALVAQQGIDHLADGPVWVAGRSENVAEVDLRNSQMPRSEAVARVMLPPK